MKEVRRLKTINEYHKARNLPPPQHPLISVVNYADVQLPPDTNNVNWLLDFYSISMKRNIYGKIKYGQQQYDFDEGVMFFMAPGQIFGIEAPQASVKERSGYLLSVHPDFLWNTSLAKNIKQYQFFDYAINEALFLSDKEENIINSILENIKQESHTNIDKFSQNIIISQIETLLNYAERFYQRQFITRKVTNHKILERLEQLLSKYFNSENVVSKGLPSVQFITQELNISAGYLSGLLKSLTGQSTQQHIQNYVLEKAKEKLSTTDLSISEIAYELGFEHSQSFSKFFKLKTQTSPRAFRQSYN